MPFFSPIFTCVDPYSEYGSGSTKVLNTFRYPIWIRIRNTGGQVAAIAGNEIRRLEIGFLTVIDSFVVCNVEN